MKIEKNTVALLEYELKTDEGEVLDSSKGQAPLAYLHGNGNLIPGLESELEGKAAGESFQVRIDPENAYGSRQEHMVQDVERAQFPEGAEIEVGMQFQIGNDQGQHMVTVVGIDGDTIKLDGNHPLADIFLNFDVKVVEVRAASEEELEHGHVHGPGGHAH